MPIEPRPVQEAVTPGQDKYSEASFQDVSFVQMMAALIASGEYAPGPLIVQLALAATAEIMYETGRWNRDSGINPQTMTPEQAHSLFQNMGRH